ncbi:MAG: hypothetical protein AUJ51_02105 [Elusimicrobia bacterium CG1_02_56_21]|nr:MAG: hypothetical protein AUJ51_02105 [Elusimicrobia bacterium CG1_02_56_21]
MAKNQDKPQEAPKINTSVQGAQSLQTPPVSTTRIWVFWCGIALAVITARVLNHLLPGISESLIERRVMLAFGAFIAAFLYKLK